MYSHILGSSLVLFRLWVCVCVCMCMGVWMCACNDSTSVCQFFYETLVLWCFKVCTEGAKMGYVQINVGNTSLNIIYVCSA